MAWQPKQDAPLVVPSGTYPAYVYVGGEQPATVTSDRVPIICYVTVNTDRGETVTKITDWVDDDYRSDSKLMQCLAAVNGWDEMPGNTDLTAIHTKGEVLVEIGTGKTRIFVARYIPVRHATEHPTPDGESVL